MRSGFARALFQAGHRKASAKSLNVVSYQGQGALIVSSAQSLTDPAGDAGHISFAHAATGCSRGAQAYAAALEGG